ncbi:hypothetical protein IT41_18875 [Paracoccus halophilus]|uniref:Uncharacterized protein n=1 Tax=Paracoccus halophilus TaxID=376733 RepID=A0A099EVG5_9RHOB|nr:hypothetical protein IT41_18875 [Paracoccus halophilus]
MAADGGVAPELASRTRDTLLIQGAGDCARTHAGGKLAENAPDNIRLGFVDLPIPANGITARIELFDDIVAKAQAATRFAVLDAASNAAMGFGSEVFQEQRVHRALEADMQLADLALGQRDNRNASKFEVLVEGGDVSLVTTDAIQCLCQHNVELSCLCVLQECLNAGAEDHARA